MMTKSIFKTIFVAIFMMSLFSCGNNEKPADTKELAQDQNEEKFETAAQENDAQFLVKAAEINLEEIQLGQLAQESGSMAEVKSLGKMMEDAHKKAQDELVALASRKNITIPTSPTDKGKNAYEKLTAKSGKDFDKEYADKMVNGHKEAIDLFEKASKNSKDPDIAALATKMLPELNMHLEHSKKTKELCEKM
jgi:putative membrane protein